MAKFVQPEDGFIVVEKVEPERPSGNPVYYLEETNILWRRADGRGDVLPDEILWPSGWTTVPGQLAVSPEGTDGSPSPSRRGTTDAGTDPLLWTRLRRISKSEAKDIALALELPTDEW